MKRLTTLALFLTSLPALACTATSPAQRVSLLELYTSEGCSSCPPADKWLSTLANTRLPVVPLAFHVDYWDKLGWPDRFASPAFSQRQQQASQRTGRSFVYTPQLLLDGQDWRGFSESRLASALKPDNSPVQITLSRQGNIVTASTSTGQNLPASDLIIVPYRNGEITRVKAGENAGSELRHDFIARSLHSTPLAQGKATLQITLPAAASNDHIVAFIQQRTDNRVLNALRLSCKA